MHHAASPSIYALQSKHLFEWVVQLCESPDEAIYLVHPDSAHMVVAVPYLFVNGVVDDRGDAGGDDTGRAGGGDDDGFRVVGGVVLLVVGQPTRKNIRAHMHNSKKGFLTLD